MFIFECLYYVKKIVFVYKKMSTLDQKLYSEGGGDSNKIRGYLTLEV